MKTKFGVALLAGAALVAMGLSQVASARMGGHSSASGRGQTVMTHAQAGTGGSHMGDTHTPGTPPANGAHMSGSGAVGTPPAGMPPMDGTHTPGTPPTDMPQMGHHHAAGIPTPPAATP